MRRSPLANSTQQSARNECRQVTAGCLTRDQATSHQIPPAHAQTSARDRLAVVKDIIVNILEETGASIGDMASVAVADGGPAAYCSPGTCDYCRTVTPPPQEPA